MGDLIGSVYIEIDRFFPLFQLPHRMIQFFHRRRDPLRKAQIDKDQQEDGEKHHK